MKSDNRNILISQTAIVRNVKLGTGVRIWHFSNIYQCRIGAHTQIGSFSEIKKNAKIGHHCRFQAYVFIPEKSIVGNYVFMGPRVTLTNDLYPSALKASQKKWKCDPVKIQDYAVIGANVVICPGVTIGTRAVIGAGSCVTKDVVPYAVMCGNPARKIGDIREIKYRKKYKEILNC